jgi:muramoyltetrapeptide carboxypeptidase LdcA involved in peptidoglycan recycling
MAIPDFKALPKLKRSDRVAVLSPSFAAPGQWPHIYELGLQRLRDDFGLEPMAYPATSKLGASPVERSADLIAAFENPAIKAVIATLGGDDQVTYIKNLPDAPFRSNPKPFFGFSDNTHFMNHLWLSGVPSYYGGSLFCEFARTPRMDEFTANYLRKALFETGDFEFAASPSFNDVGIDWDNPANFTTEKFYEPNEGWVWDGSGTSEGVTWGGCLESIDEILRHGVVMPSLEQFGGIILITETSEEIPEPSYVHRVYRALGERGILERVQGVLVGRPKAWEFGREREPEAKVEYRRQQRETILATVRTYNASVPVVQNLDFGHTSPQICVPFGKLLSIDANNRRIIANF